MSSPVITIEKLGKLYRIRHQQQGAMRYKALRDVLADTTKRLARHLWSTLRPGPHSALRTPHSEEFWALKDVSFEIAQGEVMGIIGRNGAGKSTLLKILSRITEPTKGRVRILGRVGSLLEVGTGFHPELTGRENIFLNGAILGMTRSEIKNRFDEIVAFSGVEKFIDIPVKRYSSGMNVRLAFAVAAHLEPEILIVDEVLAVGDAQFQRKCMGKIKAVASNEGSTVLFVSHNMGAVLSLCSTSILLKAGRVEGQGKPSAIINSYLKNRSLRSQQSWRADRRPGDEIVRLDAVRLKDCEGEVTEEVYAESGFWVEVDYEVYIRSAVHVGFRLATVDGIVVISSTDADGFSDVRSHMAPG
ncbi:MAG TPA: polysaccharide ABC transporter ATP-binding protein, partial [Candidatus Angelobacter sp.]|nr:polysaccharide ABC transporter ATP-binding protein [Candidatus Angelobacter sp.]